VVVSDPAGGVIEELAETIGVTTNNEAEYRALLRALELAARLGAQEVRIYGDSELVAKQVRGEYKVKHPRMKELHEQAIVALGRFPRVTITTVPRAQNARADELVNRALDGV